MVVKKTAEVSRAAATNRRSSYGPNSPKLGEKGSRTRKQIIESALKLFESHGYHQTLVDDIATSAGVSRATLYQYFESKAAIFAELASESGAHLVRIARRIEPLGPTAPGYKNLKNWLYEWMEIFSRYSTIFVEWAHVDLPATSMRPMLKGFLENHTEPLIARLRQAGFKERDAIAYGVLMVSVLERSLYIQDVFNFPKNRKTLIDSMAIAYQSLLFPSTPNSVFDNQQINKSTKSGPVKLPAYGDLFTTHGSALTEKGRATVDSLMKAANKIFSTHGYEETNIDLIVQAAGVARGTYYKYFDNKTDLYLTYADKINLELSEHFTQFARLNGSLSSLSDWLTAVNKVYKRNRGVLRVMVERQTDDPEVMMVSRTSAILTSNAFDQLRTKYPAQHLKNRTSALAMLMALMEWFPARSEGSRLKLTSDEITSAQTKFIGTALLGFS